MAGEAGVVRDRAGLSEALELIGELEARHGPALPLLAATLVVAAARAREESRGAHFRADFPAAASPPRRTFTTLDEVERTLGKEPVR
jgi:L-aspartate oxidase